MLPFCVPFGNLDLGISLMPELGVYSWQGFHIVVCQLRTKQLNFPVTSLDLFNLDYINLRSFL